MTEPVPTTVIQPEPQIGDSVDLLLRQKVLLLCSAAAFAVLGYIYTVWVPPRYEVKSTILLPGTKSSSGLASMAQSLGVAGVPSGGDTTLPMFRKILESETVTAAVARRCNIPKKDLRLIRTIDEDAKANAIDLTVQNKDKALALKVAQEYINQLGYENKELSLPGKSRKADLLSSALANKARALEKAEDQLERFVSTAITSPGMAPPPSASGSGETPSSPGVSPMFRYHDQLTTLSLELEKLDNRLKSVDAKNVEASQIQPADYPPVAQWGEKLTDLEAKLSHARSVYNADSPEVRDAQAQYDAVRKLMQNDVSKYLSAVERRVTGNASKLDEDRQAIVRQISSIRLLANAAPREAVQYQRLTRNVATLASLVSQMRLQYEQAKLESADDPNRWEVLDQPNVSEEPINKRYSRNVSLAALGGFVLAVPFALRRARRRVRIA